MTTPPLVLSPEQQHSAWDKLTVAKGYLDIARMVLMTHPPAIIDWPKLMRYLCDAGAQLDLLTAVLKHPPCAEGEATPTP